MRPRDLETHYLLAYANAGPDERWELMKDGKSYGTKVRGRLRADNGEMLLETLNAGLGLMEILLFIADPAIMAGRVKVRLPDHRRQRSGGRNAWRLLAKLQEHRT